MQFQKSFGLEIFFIIIMGQKHSTPSQNNSKRRGKKEQTAVVGASKKPELIRSNSDGLPHKCAICLDDQVKGLCCESSHFICSGCFSPYVDSNCADFGKLRDTKFEVCCPVPQCNSAPWNSHHVRNCLEGAILEKYIDTLIRVCNNGTAATTGSVHGDRRSSLLADLSDALCLKCPNCKIVLDPNPDGCCAVKCLHCATHFCWLCFNTQANSKACHAHVAKCSLNSTQGLVFASRANCTEAHKLIRATSIRFVLTKHWFQLHPEDLDCTTEKLKHSVELKALLNQFKTELNDCQMTVDDVFMEKSKIAPPMPALVGNMIRQIPWWTLVWTFSVSFLIFFLYFMYSIFTLEFALICVSLGLYIQFYRLNRHVKLILIVALVIYFRQSLWKLVTSVCGALFNVAYCSVLLLIIALIFAVL